jgi:hypothetical protein
VGGLERSAAEPSDLLRDRVLGGLGEIEDPLARQVEAAGAARLRDE